MGYAGFNILSSEQKITIDPLAIRGHGRDSIGNLRIPISIEVMPGYNNQDWSLLQMEISLGLIGDNFHLDKSYIPIYRTISHKSTILVNYEIVFPIQKIEIIERNRKEDVDLLLHFTIYHELKMGLDHAQAHIQITIPHSSYINNILNPICENPLILIEVPAKLKEISSEFAISVNELKEVIRHFNMQNYDSAVAHCRSAIEPINKDFQSIDRKFENRSKSKWLQVITLESFTWLNKMCSNSSQITSKSHHPPTTGHFSRQEAKAFYLTSVAILSFLSDYH